MYELLEFLAKRLSHENSACHIRALAAERKHRTIVYSVSWSINYYLQNNPMDIHAIY